MNEDGSAKYADYADYMINHERNLASDHWPDGGARMTQGAAPSIQNRLTAISKMAVYGSNTCLKTQGILNRGTRIIRIGRWKRVYTTARNPICSSCTLNHCRNSTMRQTVLGIISPRKHAGSIETRDEPTAHLVSTAIVENEDDYPLHALTQRPMAMYHSWGSQNAWLRQIHGMNPMYLPTKVMQEQGLVDGDWAKVSSPNGEITVPVAEMAALNENTIWTWNAIGKRRGAWAIGPKG